MLFSCAILIMDLYLQCLQTSYLQKSLDHEVVAYMTSYDVNLAADVQAVCCSKTSAEVVHLKRFCSSTAVQRLQPAAPAGAAQCRHQQPLQPLTARAVWDLQDQKRIGQRLVNFPASFGG